VLGCPSGVPGVTGVAVMFGDRPAPATIGLSSAKAADDTASKMAAPARRVRFIGEDPDILAEWSNVRDNRH
jgi:hypothetical protein